MIDTDKLRKYAAAVKREGIMASMYADELYAIASEIDWLRHQTMTDAISCETPNCAQNCAANRCDSWEVRDEK